MSTNLQLSAETRTDLGKGASRRLRREADKIPGIVYGAGKNATPITLSHKEVLKLLEHESAFSQIITLQLDSNNEQVVIRDLQRHIYKPKIQHMDLMRINANEKLTMHIPLHFLGEEECPGIKEGGVASHTITDLEVLCLPKDLPEYIEVDVSKLEMDHAIHLSEIKIPAGVELTMEIDEEHDPAVVSIHLPKEEPAEEEVVEEAAEGEEGSEQKAEGETSAKNDQADAGDAAKESKDKS